MHTSKTVQKQQAKQLEDLAQELASLSPPVLATLPVDDLFKEEIREARDLKGGARKRQIKYIAKTLRQGDPEPIFDFLAHRKGSKLKQDRDFHELERMRDAIIAEAIDAYRDALMQGEQFLEQSWRSDALEAAVERWPDLDQMAVHRAATRFAATRKPVYKRDIFRQLKATMERQSYRQAPITEGA
jgi:ribosome-associated protein